MTEEELAKIDEWARKSMNAAGPPFPRKADRIISICAEDSIALIAEVRKCHAVLKAYEAWEATLLRWGTPSHIDGPLEAMNNGEYEEMKRLQGERNLVLYGNKNGQTRKQEHPPE